MSPPLSHGLSMAQSGCRIKCSWAPLDSVRAVAPIYMHERYQLLIAGYDGCQARILVCCDGERTSFLPLLVKEIGKGLYEAYSAYGYGGFLGELVLSNNDIVALKSYLAEEGIVALFLRHSPFLSNQLLLPNGLSSLNRYTYISDLRVDNSFADHLMRAPQKLRWSANYALRAGLDVVFHSLDHCSSEKIYSFYLQYAALMADKAASCYYHFTHEFLQNHARYLGADCELAEITDPSGQSLGGALFLLDGSGWVHYHLSAVSRDAMKLQGMELLMLSALHRFGARGYLKLHLGGGHALDESDGLSRFKSKFASQKLEFHCSKLICDESAYARERSRLPLAHPSLFLISDARGVWPRMQANLA